MARPISPSALVASALLALSGCGHTPDAPATEPSAAPPSAEDAGERSTAAPAPWWEGAVGYEIFVRSFKDSDGDGIGDLRGIIDSLDYLNDGDPATSDDLGVTLLWLMPINPSPSYHGYDVTDYRGVNPDYGDLADLDALIAAAHARGVRVITDLVLNHSSRRHPWFKAALSDPASPKRAWYTFRDRPDPRWRRPWDGGQVWYRAPDQTYYYALFWEGMPDLNLANPEVEAELVDTMRWWLGRGLDGFRIDAVRHLFETPEGQLADAPATFTFVKRLRATLGAEFPEALLLGEIWSDVEDQAAYYLDGQGLHEAFSFELAGKLLAALKDGVRSDLNAILDRGAEALPDRGFEAPFLTNHDMVRVMRQLDGDDARMRLAAALLLASPGTPFIYYGEELGMRGGPSGADEDKRTPMRWREGTKAGFTSGAPWRPLPAEAPGVSVAAQREDPTSLLSLYRRLIRLRSASAALARGDQERLEIDAGRGGVAFVRAAGDERVLVVVNLDGAPSKPFVAALDGRPEVLYQEGLDGPPTRGAGGLSVPALGPRGFAWISLR